jgi:hypothetical protein
VLRTTRAGILPNGALARNVGSKLLSPPQGFTDSVLNVKPLWYSATLTCVHRHYVCNGAALHQQYVHSDKGLTFKALPRAAVAQQHSNGRST